MGPNALESTKRNQPFEIYQLKEEDILKACLKALIQEIEVLKTKDTNDPELIAMIDSHEPCFMCNGIDHVPKDCPTYFEMRGMR